jgi:hypothetical protein
MSYRRNDALVSKPTLHETASHPHSGGVHSSKLSSGWHRIRAFARTLSSLPLRNTWLELRSLPQRIVFLQQNNLDRVLLFGKMFEAGRTQPPLPNKRTNARIADTQSLKERLPWTTVVDHFLFLEGWSRGYEQKSNDPRHADVPGSCTQQTQIVPSSSSPFTQEIGEDRGEVHQPR